MLFQLEEYTNMILTDHYCSSEEQKIGLLCCKNPVSNLTKLHFSARRSAKISNANQIQPFSNET
jgi:hypothetical protein